MYAEFEIDEIQGEALTVHDRIDLHYNRVTALQVCCWIVRQCMHFVSSVCVWGAFCVSVCQMCVCEGVQVYACYV